MSMAGEPGNSYTGAHRAHGDDSLAGAPAVEVVGAAVVGAEVVDDGVVEFSEANIIIFCLRT